MFNLLSAFFAFVILGLLVLLGRAIKYHIPLLQRLYLPESIIAGAIALILSPGILGALAVRFGAAPDSYIAGGLFSENIRLVWSQSPAVFINIVFAALFLGETIPNPRDIWRKTAPQVAFGQTLAWGQYVIGLLLAITILVPVFKTTPLVGALIEVAFEGGHGTAAGMRETFTQLGFAEGGDLALGLATVGILGGVIGGTILADWGRRRNLIAVAPTPVLEGDAQFQETAPLEDRQTLQKRARLLDGLLIDPLSLNFGFTGAAVAIGWLILQGLSFLEAATWGQGD